MAGADVKQIPWQAGCCELAAITTNHLHDCISSTSPASMHAKCMPKPGMICKKIKAHSACTAGRRETLYGCYLV